MTDSPSSRQLHRLTDPAFRAPSHVDYQGMLHTREAGNIPLVTWPDGRWCHAANRFIRELYERGLSRVNRGGSLSVAAAQLSHLLRYCFRIGVDFALLSDNQFACFVENLITEAQPRKHGVRCRDANTVIAIGKVCLAFLASVGRHAGNENFVGPEGQIRVVQRERLIKPPGSKRAVRVVSWEHRSFPNPAPKKKRAPISTDLIEQMRSAVAQASTTSHQRQRRHTILRLLEVTGARRGEVAGITVASLTEAAAMNYPLLRVPTLKKRRGVVAYRYIPIARHDLSFLKQYADVHRRSIVRRRGLEKSDHGILLVSETSGMPLRISTITQEVRILRIAAGIEEKACPHMFRHRFLTKLFVALVEQHSLENPDSFRRMLLCSEAMKQKVMEWSGHASITSLDTYIDLAFDEISNFGKTFDSTSACLAIDSFSATIDIELAAVASGEPPDEILKRMKSQLHDLKADLARRRGGNNPAGNEQ